MVTVIIEPHTSAEFTGAIIREPKDNYVFFDPGCRVSRELFGDNWEGLRKIPDAVAYDLFPEATEGARSNRDYKPFSYWLGAGTASTLSGVHSGD